MRDEELAKQLEELKKTAEFKALALYDMDVQPSVDVTIQSFKLSLDFALRNRKTAEEFVLKTLAFANEISRKSFEAGVKLGMHDFLNAVAESIEEP